jgi:hypothetical protein
MMREHEPRSLRARSSRGAEQRTLNGSGVSHTQGVTAWEARPPGHALAPSVHGDSTRPGRSAAGAFPATWTGGDDELWGTGLGNAAKQCGTWLNTAQAGGPRGAWPPWRTRAGWLGTGPVGSRRAGGLRADGVAVGGSGSRREGLDRRPRGRFQVTSEVRQRLAFWRGNAAAVHRELVRAAKAGGRPAPSLSTLQRAVARDVLAGDRAGLAGFWSRDDTRQ